MELKPLLAALVTTTALVLSGCAASTAPTAPAPTASAPTTAPTNSPTQTAIDGAWLSRLAREQITRQLKDAGLAKWTEQFLKREEIDKASIAVYSFENGRFDVAYFERKGIWKVGWKGPYSVAGDEVTMIDDFTGITDVFRWRITERGLHLDRVSASSDTITGFPYAVYDAGYLSDTWPRTDCAMEPGKSC